MLIALFELLIDYGEKRIDVQPHCVSIEALNEKGRQLATYND
jgi:hypothetical protein